MYTHKIHLMVKGCESREQQNDIVYTNIVFYYVTTKITENGALTFKSVLRAVDLPEPDSNFIPSEQVTNETIIEWVKANINETELQNINIAEHNK